MDTFVFDLAACLTDNGDRLPLLGYGNWREYFARMSEDQPRHEILQLWHSLDGYKIVVSGEPESHRNLVIDWLDRYNLSPKMILLRPDNERRPNAVYKSTLIDTLPKDALYVDDDRATIVMLRKHHRRAIWTPSDVEVVEQQPPRSSANQRPVRWAEDST